MVIDVTTIDVAPSWSRRSPTTCAVLFPPLTDHTVASAVHRAAVPSVPPSERRTHPRCVPWAFFGVFWRKRYFLDGGGSTPYEVAALHLFFTHSGSSSVTGRGRSPPLVANLLTSGRADGEDVLPVAVLTPR